MTLAGATVAVTGATGFLGRYVVDGLLRRGARVVGVVRSPGRVPELAALGVELRAADLGDAAALAAGFRGADAVVSNAALLPLRNFDWHALHATNIGGTANVFAAVRAAGVRRVVHVSSVSVYRPHGAVRVDENHPQHSEGSRTLMNPYAVSKALAEQAAWRLAESHGVALTTVRPCGIYGAFDTNFMQVFRWLLRPPVTLFPSRLQLPLVYAGDVADAIVRALERPASAGRAYNTTGDDLSIWDFLDAWRAAGGPTSRWILPVPLPIARAFDHGRAVRELGWGNRPPVDGLRETLAIERAGGWLGLREGGRTAPA